MWTTVRTDSLLIGSTVALTPQAAGNRGGDFGQGLALSQLLGAEQVGRQVGVAQTEPGLGVVALQRFETAEAFVRQPPAFGLIDGIGQRIGDGIEIRRHAQAEKLVVVAGVDHHAQTGRIDDPHQPAQKAGRSHPAGQSGDPEVVSPWHAGLRKGPAARWCQ